MAGQPAITKHPNGTASFCIRAKTADGSKWEATSTKPHPIANVIKSLETEYIGYLRLLLPDGQSHEESAAVDAVDPYVTDPGKLTPREQEIYDRAYALGESSARARKDGVGLIAAERQRQMDAEGWTPDHDDEHESGQLTAAAVCYVFKTGEQHAKIQRDGVPRAWPWEPRWWKPSADPIRNLVKAGALIAAEIDRLQRLADSASSVSQPSLTAGAED